MTRSRSINFPNTRDEMEDLFDKLQRPLCNFCLDTPSLRIKGGSADTLAEAQNAVRYMIDGVLRSKAAADMAALSGTVTADAFNVFVFTLNAAGTYAARMGTEAATLAGVTFPTIPDGEVVVGFVIINPTGTGNFVGGTTDLDDATVVPNAVFVNTPYPFLPGMQTI